MQNLSVPVTNIEVFRNGHSIFVQKVLKIFKDSDCFTSPGTSFQALTVEGRKELKYRVVLASVI